MAVDKFSISLPSELTADIDELADREGLSRSALIREATVEYVTAKRSAAQAAGRRQRVERAISGFDEIASRWGADERTALELLREVRGEDDVATAQDAGADDCADSRD